MKGEQEKMIPDDTVSIVFTYNQATVYGMYVLGIQCKLTSLSFMSLYSEISSIRTLIFR